MSKARITYINTYRKSRNSESCQTCGLNTFFLLNSFVKQEYTSVV